MAKRSADFSSAFKRAIHQQFIRDPRFRFWYFVPHHDQDLRDTTPFMSFTSGILRTAPLFSRIVEWPSDIREPFERREDVLFARIAGVTELRVTPIEFSAFSEVSADWQMPLRCVISNELTCDWISQEIGRSPLPWMHISTEPGNGRIPFATADDDNFLGYASVVLAALKATGRDAGFCLALTDILSRKRERAVRQVDCPAFEHNITAPNEAALRSLRMRTRFRHPLRPNQPKRYVDAMIRSAEVVAQRRERLLPVMASVLPSTDLTLVLDGVLWHMYRGHFDDPPAGLEQSRKVWKAAIRAARRRETFVSEIDSAWVDDPGFRMITSIRMQELHALTVALILHNSSTMTPVLRLDPRVNKLRGNLTQIGNCSRGNGPHRDFKLNRMVSALSRKIRSHTDVRTIHHLERYSDSICSIQIVSDMPIEWMRIADSHLALRHDTSRVPLTPGSLMFGQCAKATRTFLSQNDFKEVLVVRSFAHGDPIRPILERVLKNRKNADSGTTFRFVDVATPEEFIDALRHFSGAMMIFDGHGYMDGSDAAGTIVIGGQQVHLWEYRKELNVPPIVLLSACDTLPIDGSHVSSAVGLLAVGATTVLATLLPIHAAKAAIFLGRLALRMEEFIPAMLKIQPNGVDWRLMMAGMLRMSHASELLRALLEHHIIDSQAYEKLQLLANIHINRRNPDWYEVLKSRIVEESKLPEDRVRAAIEEHGALTDALKYVQVGRPDLIMIVNRTLEETLRDLESEHQVELPYFYMSAAAEATTGKV